MGDVLGAVVNLASGGIFGGLLGFVARLAPDIIGLFRAKGDRDHEYRMAQLSASDKAAERDMRVKEAGFALEKADIDALIAGARAQARPSGVKWIDGLSASVRPVMAYWWMALYTAYKAACIIVVWGAQGQFAGTMLRVWTGDDTAILSSIIAFWYMDRTIRNRERSA